MVGLVARVDATGDLGVVDGVPGPATTCAGVDGDEERGPVDLCDRVHVGGVDEPPEGDGPSERAGFRHGVLALWARGHQRPVRGIAGAAADDPAPRGAAPLTVVPLGSTPEEVIHRIVTQPSPARCVAPCGGDRLLPRDERVSGTAEWPTQAVALGKRSSPDAPSPGHGAVRGGQRGVQVGRDRPGPPGDVHRGERHRRAGGVEVARVAFGPFWCACP